MSKLSSRIDLPPASDIGGSETVVRREGKYLVVLDGAVLPCRCAICNKPADDRAVEMNFRMSNGSTHSTGFVDMMIELVVYWFVQRKRDENNDYIGPISAMFYFCPQHRRTRSLPAALIGLAMILLGAWIAWINNLANSHGPAVAIGVMMAIVGVFVCFGGMGGGPPLRQYSFVGRWIWLSGSQEEFLSTLPTQGVMDGDASDASDG